MTVSARNLQTIKIFLTLELSQYCNSGSNFSSSEPVVASSDCSWLRNTLYLCLPIQPAQAVPEHCSKSSAIDFAVKTFNYLIEYPSGVIARWLAGAWTWNQTWSVCSFVQHYFLFRNLWMEITRTTGRLEVILLFLAYITFWINGSIVWQMNYPSIPVVVVTLEINVMIHLFRNQECWNWFCIWL